MLAIPTIAVLWYYLILAALYAGISAGTIFVATLLAVISATLPPLMIWTLLHGIGKLIEAFDRSFHDVSGRALKRIIARSEQVSLMGMSSFVRRYLDYEHSDADLDHDLGVIMIERQLGEVQELLAKPHDEIDADRWEQLVQSREDTEELLVKAIGEHKKMRAESLAAGNNLHAEALLKAIRRQALR